MNSPSLSHPCPDLVTVTQAERLALEYQRHGLSVVARRLLSVCYGQDDLTPMVDQPRPARRRRHPRLSA
mgnify:CR=1 FL=1